MPVEINELVIKATISDAADSSKSTSESAGSLGNESALELVEKAVKEVMDHLKRKNER
jgi:Family of unknown function (DUF5908)